MKAILGLLKNVQLSSSRQFLVHVIPHQEVGGNVQKGASSKAAGQVARGAYTAVREHDNGPRTSLAPIFNIPILSLSVYLFLIGCSTYNLIEPKRTTIGDHYTVHPQTIWSTLRNGKLETWTIDGPSLQALHFVKGLEHGDQLVGGGSNENHPEFKKDMTVLEIQEFIVDNFSRRGYAQIDEMNLRPQKFGRADGFWFDMTYVDPNGLDGQATVAGAVVDEQLHLVIYSGIAHYFTKHKEHVERLIESIEMPSVSAMEEKND